jgi:TctA family transporter
VILALLMFALLLAVLGAGAVSELLWVLVLLILVAMIVEHGGRGRVP